MSSSEPDPADTLVLASASPRRSALLTEAGVAYEVIPANTPEKNRPGEAPADMAMRLAAEKALAVAERIGPRPRREVLGADTIVVIGERVLGKPTDPEDAVRLLGLLTGTTHQVMTGFALVDSVGLRPETHCVASFVTMREVGEDEIRRYVATGEPLDKAGAYALQGQAADFVTGFEGSRSNIIGLPVDEVVEAIEERRRRATR